MINYYSLKNYIACFTVDKFHITFYFAGEFEFGNNEYKIREDGGSIRVSVLRSGYTERPASVRKFRRLNLRVNFDILLIIIGVHTYSHIYLAHLVCMLRY